MTDYKPGELLQLLLLLMLVEAAGRLA